MQKKINIPSEIMYILSIVCLAFSVAVIMTLAFNGKLVGIGIGTVIMTLVNGVNIDFFTKVINKYINTTYIFKKLPDKFTFTK